MRFLSEEIIPIYGLRELNATKLIDWSTEQISMGIVGRTGIMGKQLAKRCWFRLKLYGCAAGFV